MKGLAENCRITDVGDYQLDICREVIAPAGPVYLRYEAIEDANRITDAQYASALEGCSVLIVTREGSGASRSKSEACERLITSN